MSLHPLTMDSPMLIAFLACYVADRTSSEPGNQPYEAAVDPALDTSEPLDTGEPIDTSTDSAQVEDTGPGRPCAFIDTWVDELHVGVNGVYSYSVSGCGQLNDQYPSNCEDATIATTSADTP